MKDFLKSGFNVIIDGQWGSTGKGKLAGYLGSRCEIDFVTCDFQPNAGHTFVADDGTEVITHQLPSSAMTNDDCRILLNAGSGIDVARLMKEIDLGYNISSRLFIHPLACVVTEKHKLAETKKGLKHISSTLQGGSAALCEKISRLPDTVLAKDVPELESFIADTSSLLRKAIRGNAVTLCETAQGFFLSQNYGNYPFVTGRDVTVATAINNAGVSVQDLALVIGSVRTFPIRVGNVDCDFGMRGNSGPCFGDQIEVGWDYISSSCGRTIREEKTTVTGKIRRVFTFSESQLKTFLDVCRPTHLFINFMNYVASDSQGKRTTFELMQIPKCVEFLDWIKLICDEFKCSIKFIGTGPNDSDMVCFNEAYKESAGEKS